MNNLKLTATSSQKQGEPKAPGGFAVHEEDKPKKKQRTWGLWLFDASLYFLSNIVVFAISVAATYLTTAGGVFEKNSDGTIKKDENDKPIPVLGEDGIQKHDGRYKVFGFEFGRFMFRRGAILSNTLQSGKILGWEHGVKLSKDQADMAKMVFFSFLDGTLVAPLVKLLEDRREKIARWMDEKMGTVPKDESVYEAEPKQTWGSVLMGRFATAAIIVPTAVLMDKFGKDTDTGNLRFSKGKDDKRFKSMNDIAFNDPGKKFGERMDQEGKMKWLGKTDKKELFRTSAFEFFYTTVCTFGLYVSSRLIAKMTGKTWGAAHEKQEKKKHEAEVKAHATFQHDVKEKAEEKHAEAERKPIANDGLRKAPSKATPQGNFSERHDPAHATQSDFSYAL